MLENISKKMIADVVTSISEVSSHDRDEMAIPSYLHTNPLIRWLMWKRLEKCLQLAELKSTDTVFEFGCGIGLFLPSLAKNCKKVYATDLFPQFAKTLTEKLQVGITFVDSLNDVPNGTLDAVFAADVLEHVDDPSQIAALIRQKMKPGARFIVCGPTENFIYKFGRLVAGFGDKGHYHHTNIKGLVSDIARAGFKVEKSVALPFAAPPHLFRIYRFLNTSSTIQH